MSDHWKAKHVDLSVILTQPVGFTPAPAGPDTLGKNDGAPSGAGAGASKVREVAVRRVMSQDHELDQSLDFTKLIKMAEPALERGERVTVRCDRERERTVHDVSGKVP